MDVAESSSDTKAIPRLEVVSDTICPWCYIGKRRLAAALAELATEGFAFEVVWRPFQLNPGMPREGLRPARLSLGQVRLLGAQLGARRSGRRGWGDR